MRQAVTPGMEDRKETLGIIAGGGQFPLLAAEAAKKRGHMVVAVAHKGETDPALEDYVDRIVWVRLGQLGHMIKALKKNGASKALMAGSITKRKMFENVLPDLKGLAVMSKLAIFHDDDILRAVAGELEREGIKVVGATVYLPELHAPEGCLTRRKPSRAEREDILFGWRVAKELGRLDIGQCVVVKRKTVLALEAIDGTDETIRRGGRIAKQGAVVVKVSKPEQDMRFDVPTVGRETISVMEEVKASVLAVEAGKTLLFDREEMVARANEVGMTIVCQ